MEKSIRLKWVHQPYFQGDNGGPWVCKSSYGWALVGIHSYGLMHDGCRSGGRAGTRVSYYADWIANNNGGHGREADDEV